mmetsp:Transcript_23757/g.29548  ORF Transcript_23757/g.29548 Transcript_23757/m.29548 type:complete len:192 (+) Transcript_23757:20-595(+)
MVEQKVRVDCQALCQDVREMSPIWDVNGDPKGFQCPGCQAVRLHQRGLCSLCVSEHAVLYELGADKRCANCWEKLIKFNRKHGIPKSHCRASLDYACSFCKEVTTIHNVGVLGYCGKCGAEGTMNRTICPRCLQLEFTYHNMGEKCINCIESVPREEDFAASEIETRNCPYFCLIESKFVPIKKILTRVGS